MPFPIDVNSLIIVRTEHYQYCSSKSSLTPGRIHPSSIAVLKEGTPEAQMTKNLQNSWLRPPLCTDVYNIQGESKYEQLWT